MADIEKTRLSNDDRALWNLSLSRRRDGAGVNKRREAEPETQRNGRDRPWNRRALGGPTVASWNGETNGDANVFERLRGRAERCRQQSGVNQRREWFGSSRATLQETEIVARKQRVCKPLIIKQAR